MASAALGAIGGSLFKGIFKKKKKEDPNAVTTTTTPTADDTLARIEAERRLRKEKGESGRAGSILSRGTLG